LDITSGAPVDREDRRADSGFQNRADHVDLKLPTVLIVPHASALNRSGAQQRTTISHALYFIDLIIY
jgi:hypothetical protein